MLARFYRVSRETMVWHWGDGSGRAVTRPDASGPADRTFAVDSGPFLVAADRSVAVPTT